MWWTGVYGKEEGRKQCGIESDGSSRTENSAELILVFILVW